MTISKGEAAGAIMIGCRLINPGVRMRIEQTSIVNAAGMLIAKDPSVGRPRKNELTRLLDVFVNGVPRTALGVAFANTDITGHAPGAFSPASVSLRGAYINIGRAFEDILALGNVLSQFRIL